MSHLFRDVTVRVLVLVSLLGAGCGRLEKSVPVAVKTPVEQAQAILEQFAEQGETDSSIVALRELIEAIAATDPSKSVLVARCDDLMSIRGKDKVRAKAKEMLESLQ